MGSIRSELFGKCKFVQIPIDNRARVKTILVDKKVSTQSDGSFCYVIYHYNETPALDSYKKMGIAFNCFPDSLGQSIVTVRFTETGTMFEESIPMSSFIINPFELTEDISKAVAKANQLVSDMDSGWENQVENGNLYTVSKLMED